MIQKRNVITCFLLSIITCGLYGIYWMIVLTDDINYMENEQATSGVVSVILTIITCGIYYFYWSYKMGEKMARIRYKEGIRQQNNSILYLILSLFGYSGINNILIQSELNNIIDETRGYGY